MWGVAGHERGVRCEVKEARAEFQPEPSHSSWCGVEEVPLSLDLWFSSVQFSRSVVSDSVTPWTAVCQASLSFTNSQSPPKPMSLESVTPSNHLLLCRSLLLPPSIFPSIRVFSNQSVLCNRWPKYWSFSFNISPSNEHPGLISFRMGWLDLSKGLSRVFSNTTLQKHQFFGSQLSI